MKVLHGFVLGLMAAFALAAHTQVSPSGAVASLAGDWQGKIAGSLPAILHLRTTPGGLILATVDSPSQGAFGLAGANEQVNGATLTFDVPVVHASYTGSVSPDGKAIVGTWRQAGQALPLEFRLAATAAQLAEVSHSPIDGDWNGVLRAGGLSLRVVFHFRPGPGGIIVCSMDSLDQQALGIDCSDVKLNDRSVLLRVPSVNGTWAGTLSEDGQCLHGTWSQGGPLTLDLVRSSPATRPSEPAPAQPPIPLSGLKPLLDREIAPVLAAWPQGGIVLGILDHGQRQVAAWGAAKPDSIFEIGSVTKTFTALLLAQMAVQKKLSLDEPVRELLPAGWVPDPAGPEISLLDLATHHAGLPRLPDNLRPASQADPYADYTPDRLRAFVAQRGLARPEKPAFLYSNVGVGLLGYALALRAGMSWPDLIARQITGPLGMRDTVVGLSPEQQKRFLQGYSAAHDPVQPWHMNALAGAGALHSTVADLLTYAAALLHPEHLRGNPDTASLEEAVALTLSPRADVDPSGAVKIALAWMVPPEEDRYWHDGGTGGFTALVSLEPKRDRAIVVLYNCEDNTPGKLALTGRVAENVRALLDGKPAIQIGE